MACGGARAVVGHRLVRPVSARRAARHLAVGDKIKGLQADTGASVRIGAPGALPELRLVTAASVEPAGSFQVAAVEGALGVLGYLMKPSDAVGNALGARGAGWIAV
jgi:hypothetical protein